MVIWTISNLIVFIVCLIVFFIFLRNGSKKIHRIAAFLNLATATWGFGGFLIGLARNSSEAILFWKIGLVGATLVPISSYHLVVTLRGFDRKFVTFLVYSFGVLFLSSAVFDFGGIAVVYLYNAIYYIKAIDYRWIALLTVWAGLIFYSLFEMFRLYIAASGARRTQFLYLLIGLTMGFSGAILNALPMVGINIFPVANNILVCFYSICVAYAMLRHQLLEIEVIVKKTLVFAGLFGFVYAVVAGLAYLVQSIFQGITGVSRWLAMIPSVVIIIVTLKPLEKILVSVTDKYLFQKRYDYKELLRTFSSDVLTILDLNKLTEVTVKKLADIIKLKECRVLLFDEKREPCHIAKSYVFRRDISEGRIPVSSDIIGMFNSLDAELILPISTSETTLGALILGKKKSDRDFSDADLDILVPLVKTIAIAVSNAKLFAELEKAQAEAAQKEKMAVMGTLAAGMAHEIRSPVMTMKIFSEYLPEKSCDPAFLDKYKKIVIKEVDKIDHVIQTMVDFSSDRDGQDDVDLDAAVGDMISLVSLDMDIAGRINMVKNIPTSLPKVRFNRSELDEVLLNITQNAVHAISGKGRIEFTAIDKGDAVELVIKDDGCGIPEDIMKSIFSPFFTTRSKGFGLGLFIVSELIRRNNGKISVESEVDRGTVFKLNLQGVD